MKSQTAKYVIVALLSFVLGGWLSASQYANISGVVKNAASISPVYASSDSSSSAADIVDTVGPAVVYIEANINASNNVITQGFFRWYMPQQAEKATGTGFIIDPNGYILTNQHVVNNAGSISVKLQGRNNSIKATVVGQDYELDLAVLKIDATNLPTIPMGNSDTMRPGDAVIAIGNPLGLDHTVTVGVISAKGRPISIEDRNYKNLIQTDAAINPGNSGGPLINMQGQVIAINTAITTDAQGIGFAIPINTAKSILQELMTNGKVIRPYLGISMVDITSAVAAQLQISPDTEGIIIEQVVSNSPAAMAGLKQYDILTSIDGHAMSNSSSVQEYIQKQQVGQTVKLGILRNSQKLTISAVLKEQP